MSKKVNFLTIFLDRQIIKLFVFDYRLPGVSDCSAGGQIARVTSNLHPTSTMAVSRVPSPPPLEVNTPVAENWCYTQVSRAIRNIPVLSFKPRIQKQKCFQY